MATGGMEPEEPKRIRPQVVDDIVWVLEHSCGDVDVTAAVLRLFGASEAEFDLAFAISGERPCLSGDADVEALQAKIVRLLFGDARELDDPPQTRWRAARHGSALRPEASTTPGDARHRRPRVPRFRLWRSLEVRCRRRRLSLS
jgi:hypothetical protein